MRRPKTVDEATAAQRVSGFMPPPPPEPPPPPTPRVRQHAHRPLQALTPPPRHDVDTDGGHVAIHGGTLQRPHPIDQTILLALEGRTVQNVDGDHDMAA